MNLWAACCLLAAAAACIAGILTPERGNIMGWIKFDTVDGIPKDHFDKRKSLYAFVERVIDGDTVRVRHLPGYNWRRWKHPAPLASRGIADQTLSVRIYGVDCPELAKFGSKSQPYGPEARDFTARLVLHRVVLITFLRRDQYKRAICHVQTVPSRLFSWIPLDMFRPKDLSVELATAGLAELYTGGGAEYCNNRELLERRIERAKRRGRGMWALGDQRVSAADYKRGRTAPAQRKSVGAASASAADPLMPSSPSKVAVPFGQKRRRNTKVLDTVVTGLEFGVG